MNTVNIIYEDKYFIAIYKESGIEVDDNLIKLIKKNIYIYNLFLTFKAHSFLFKLSILLSSKIDEKACL